MGSNGWSSVAAGALLLVTSTGLLGVGACIGPAEPIGDAVAGQGGAGDYPAGGADAGQVGRGGASSAGGAGGASDVAGDAGGGGGPTVNAFPCEGAKERDGGFVSCSNGARHRPVAGVCPSALPRSGPVIDSGAAGGPSECFDADCKPGEFCSSGPFCEGSAAGTDVVCLPGCTTDGDCQPGNVCVCGDGFEPPIPTGYCVPASCKTDADCEPGLLCTSYMAGYHDFAFACQTPQDECGGDQDCQDSYCRYVTPSEPRVPRLSVRRQCGDSGQCGGP